MSIRTVGVRELKAHLSRILRDVQGGEIVLVTDRGRVVAELRGPGATAWTQSRVERALGRMAAEGVLRLAERAQEPYEASPLRSPAGSARALITEDRDER
ncbi:MAG: type II toxin-antitoxin system Phd/YefM family antitoxin [Gemmatimonadaceae bacterium]